MMNSIHGLVMLIAFLNLSISSAEPFVDEKCPRIRRPVDELSIDELMLYVEGLQAIRANGIYEVLVDAHHEHRDIHHGSSFFFYHTYYVWEVETQIRNLGGKFECFGLPYYDWTIDAGFEDDPWILDSVFGGDGDHDHFDCVTAPHGNDSVNWNTEQWPTYNCAEGEDPDPACCLKRYLSPDCELSNATTVGGMLKVDDFTALKEDVAVGHDQVHKLLADPDLCPICALYLIDDPVFMMLHSFIGYLRAVWASCHEYDLLSGDDLDENPMAYSSFCDEGHDECGVIELDDVFEFGDLVNYSWSLASQMDVTPRMMWDFTNWNVRWAPGQFIIQSDILRSDDGICSLEHLMGSPWMEWNGEESKDEDLEGENRRWPWRFDPRTTEMEEEDDIEDDGGLEMGSRRWPWRSGPRTTEVEEDDDIELIEDDGGLEEGSRRWPWRSGPRTTELDEEYRLDAMELMEEETVYMSKGHGDMDSWSKHKVVIAVFLIMIALLLKLAFTLYDDRRLRWKGTQVFTHKYELLTNDTEEYGSFGERV